MMESNDDGFSLIEVLVALAILTLALTSLYRLMGVSFDAYKRADEKEEALLYAASQLEAARLRGLPAVLSGHLRNGQPWRMRTEPIAADPNDASLHWIVIDVGRDVTKPVVSLRTLSE